MAQGPRDQAYTNEAAHVVLTSGGTALGTTAAGLPVVDANLSPVEYGQVTTVAGVTQIYEAAVNIATFDAYGTTTVTISTSTAHGLTAGQSVVIAGVTVGGTLNDINGTRVVASITDTDTFVVTFTHGGSTPGSGADVYSGGTAAPLSLFGTTLPTGATVALIQCLTQNVRWRDDGTNPTATTGMQLAAGDQFFYTGDLANIRFFEEAASAELNVTLYKQA